MLKDSGAPNLPPNTRALTQPANLAASEIPDMGMYPGAAPGSAFLLSGVRKFGLPRLFGGATAGTCSTRTSCVKSKGGLRRLLGGHVLRSCELAKPN